MSITDLTLSSTTVSETAFESQAVATIIPTGGSADTYTIVSDSSGGGFAIVGDKLVVRDSFRLDYETQPVVNVEIVAIRNGVWGYKETFSLTVTDAEPEARYLARAEVLVNTGTSGLNTPIAVTDLVSGGYVIMSRHVAAGVDRLRAAFYDVEGLRTGDIAFQISDRSGGATAIDSAPMPDGGMLLVYEGAPTALPGGGTGSPIRAQRFTSAGNETHADVIISTDHAGATPVDPSVAVLASGNYLVTWTLPRHEEESGGGASPSQIVARFMDPNGLPFGPEFRVNTATEGAQHSSEVEATANGGFVVTWRDSAVAGIKGQYLDGSANKVGGEFTILSGASELVHYELEALTSGNVAVSWTELVDDSGPVNLFAIKLQLVSPNGALIGAPPTIAT